MRLVDANVLIYAADSASEHHVASRTWIERALSARETVLLPWLSLVAFLRLGTHPRMFAVPIDTATALSIVDSWLARPNTVTPEPDIRNAQRIRELLTAAGGRGGTLMNDAHLAALALQWGATVVTFASDFGRFPGVRWETPSVGGVT